MSGYPRHGHALRGQITREYSVWLAMKARCCNPKNKAYHHYGGRGIAICQEWLDDFAAFLRDMGPKPSPKHTLERVDNDRGYEPGNCRWATRREQNRNTRRNRPVIRSDGVRYPTVIEACEATGADASNLMAACAGRQKTSAGFGWQFA